jgi:hypothetical protein
MSNKRVLIKAQDLAAEHHRKHGDMDNDVCLLNECALHYPQTGSEVNHPDHYNRHPTGVECIDIVEHFNFNLGNAIKYIWRAGLKGEAVEDLRKAIWYIDREIQRIESSDRRGNSDAGKATEISNKDDNSVER